MKFLVPYKKKRWWLPVIIVCSLFLCSQPLVFAEPECTREIFDYISSPNVHAIDENIIFKCVFSPFITPDNVTIHFVYPNSNSSSLPMIEIRSKKFVNTTSFSTNGRYSFFISALVNDDIVYSISRSFWVTLSLSDKDNDKMNDEWEQFYGFDDSDPKDAFYDIDGDGYKNLDEFTMGTDPLEADYIEFILFYIDSHFNHIILTLFFIVIALSCSLFGLRRSTRWI